MSYLANAAVILHGQGVDSTLSSPCGVLYMLAPNHTLDDNSNPATTFRMKFMPRVISADTPGFEALRGILDNASLRCKLAAEKHRAENPYHPDYAGAISSVVMIEDTEQLHQFTYPIYRLGRYNDCPPDPVPVAIWTDIMSICRTAVENGMVLKSDENSGNVQTQPLVGRLRRAGKKWKWVLSEEENAWMASQVSCDDTPFRAKD